MKFAELVNQFVDLINTAIPVLAGVALLLFLVNIVRYIYKAGDAGGKAPERAAIGWGLLALFVIFSIWGILQILQQIFGFSSV